MRLAVELYGTRIGTLTGHDARSFDFEPSTDAVQAFGAGSTILSLAIPLLPPLPRGQAAKRRNWFSELLPEGRHYEYMLAARGLRQGDTLGFLASYGRDIAGAIELWDLDDPTEPQTPSITQLDESEIRALLEQPLKHPLANHPTSGKTSLAGVQPKVVLASVDGVWHQVMGGYPSTHILKPQIDHAPFMIYDEEYGARVMRGLGLTAYDTQIQQFAGKHALVIERYDREDGHRIHQEDFNQVLGASGIEKYQEYGGKVSLARIAATLERGTQPEGLLRLATRVVAGAALGDLDMHAKNIGILHPPSGAATLTPAYDVVPQALYPGIDGKLALAINKKYRLSTLTGSDLVQEIRSWGVRNPLEHVTTILEQVKSIVTQEEPLEGSHEGLRADILERTAALLASLQE